MNDEESRKAGATLGDSMNADVLFFNGEIDQLSCRKLINLGAKRNRAESVVLVLVTPGGDPDAAFKIGRFLQSKYNNVAIYIPGWCKSAGTLVALAGQEIYIGDCGELGPLDIQIAKADEILEMGSGLAVDAAMKTLEATASKMFFNLLLSIRRDTGGMITTRTASELASNMVVKLLDPIYRQIDPMKIGENSRAMNITKSYGKRLAMTSGCLRTTRSLDFLISSYPDHGFVIDRREAESLFTKVHEPTPEMEVLAEALGEAGLTPQKNLSTDGSAHVVYLSPETPTAPRSASTHESTGTTISTSKGSRRPSRGGNRETPTTVGVGARRSPSGSAPSISSSAGNGSAQPEA